MRIKAKNETKLTIAMYLQNHIFKQAFKKAFKTLFLWLVVGKNCSMTLKNDKVRLQ